MCPIRPMCPRDAYQMRIRQRTGLVWERVSTGGFQSAVGQNYLEGNKPGFREGHQKHAPSRDNRLLPPREGNAGVTGHVHDDRRHQGTAPFPESREDVPRHE